MTVPAADEPRDCVDAAPVRFPPGEPGMVRTYAGQAQGINLPHLLPA